MPLSIKNPDADRLARALAQRTGETLTEAVIKALRERLDREERKQQTVESFSRRRDGDRTALRVVAAARQAPGR